jgi:hypothetical protein
MRQPLSISTLALALFISLPSFAREPSKCKSVAGIYGPAPTPSQHESMRKLVHEVARAEGVEPAALEAIAMVETGLRPAVGYDCELGPFQVMQFWARVFHLGSPAQLWDLRVNATAAARIYKAALKRWRPRYAALGRNKALRKAGFRGKRLDKQSFAALVYHWGGAPAALASADPATMSMPSSAARYAVRFKSQLARAQARLPPRGSLPRRRSS